MTHREYRLIVKKNIMESAGYDRQAVHYKIGDIVTVDQTTFEALKSGSTFERLTREGMIRFDKHNFENEAQYTEVTIEYGTGRLGQRKSK
jgi:hypothetical protein